MEFKGTKGNWILRENQSTVMSDEKCLIARIFDGKGSALLEQKEQSDEIVLANAKLVSSAPKLLEALQKLIELKNLKDTYGKDCRYLEAQPIAWNFAKEVLEETLT